MTLLCYGDSNTYGFDPRSYFGGRYPAERSPGGRGNSKTSSAGQRTRTW